MENQDLENQQTYRKAKLPVGRLLRWKAYFWKGLQIFHFLIAMSFLWAGLVEFINNPPYFDAYGDATSEINLPSGLFENDPRLTEESMLRLMDVPILATLVGYILVSLWLKFQGPSWLITGSLTLTFICFWIVNFWAKETFEWRYFSSRMSGLELQVSTLALSTTTVFMVLFERRKRMPFKFKSSLHVKKLGKLHIGWNFVAIYLITFTSMLLWFTKLYSSWACFRSQEEILRICQVTNQVQCIPCAHCHSNAIKRCVKDNRELAFSCSTPNPSPKAKGAFCIFNYNMGIYGFLSTFAYIGGLCVFLSTFAGIFGHYTLRALFLLRDLTRSFGKRSNQYFSHRMAQARNRGGTTSPKRYIPDRELLTPGVDCPTQGEAQESSDSDDDEMGSWVNASCG